MAARPGTRTLVAVADLMRLYDRENPTVRGWPSLYGFEPVAVVSDTAVYDLDQVIPKLGDRETSASVLEEIRARATIQVPTVVVGIAEIGEILGVHRTLVANWSMRGQLPEPIALLRPALTPAGKPARQLKVWDLKQVLPPKPDKAFVAEITKRNTIR